MTDTIIAIGGYQDWDIEGLKGLGDVTFLPSTDDIPGLPEKVKGAATVVAFKEHVAFDDAVMAQLPGLRLIANFGVGYDAIDVGAATARGIAVTNTPDVLNDDVADLTVAMLIAQSRQIVEGSHHVRSGAWATEGAMALNRKVSGGKAGIVGLGRIGREIADRLAAFRMEIHYTSRRDKDTPGWIYHADVVSMARAVDYLIVAIVGGPETEGHVTAEAIEALGPDGIIVNISRGSTIDEEAMIRALQTGGIRAAALDVFRGEPSIDQRFLELDNVLLQPHQGSATIETRKAMGRLQRDNISAYLKGARLITPVA